MKILALEASTTSAKAMLYDTQNDTYQVKTKTYIKMYDDVTIHDAKKVYEQMTEVGKEIANGQKIDMIALGGTWHSVMLCDKNMVPKTPIYLWSYTGAAGLCKELRKDKKYVDKYYKKTGCMVNAIYPFFKLKLLQQNGYDLKEYNILGQGTYNTYRLTGQKVVTQCIASGSGLMDIHAKEYDKELLDVLGIKEDQLGKLVDYKKTFPLTKEGAEELGLTEGIPVIPTNSDGGLNQVGVGALKDGVMTFSVGTSGAIRLTTSKPVIPDTPSTWCYLSPKSWLCGAATSGCCNCIDWIREKLFDKNMLYQDIEKGIKNKDDTPVFLPFIFGERCPGWNDDRCGGFEGLRPEHTKYEMYRAVQEGVLFNLYHCFDILGALIERPRKIKLSGGILHSPAWLQMCADIFGSDMEVDEVDQGSLMGGVVLAMELLGVIKDAYDYDVTPSKIVHPDMKAREKYMKKYEQYMRYYKSYI